MRAASVLRSTLAALALAVSVGAARAESVAVEGNFQWRLPRGFPQPAVPADNPMTAQKVRLEGHADERGSREYNIGLGERRGQAVRRALALQGVAETQLSTVSYGEERPVEAGSTEQAYSKNRRVEIVYLK